MRCSIVNVCVCVCNLCEGFVQMVIISACVLRTKAIHCVLGFINNSYMISNESIYHVLKTSLNVPINFWCVWYSISY